MPVRRVGEDLAFQDLDIVFVGLGDGYKHKLALKLVTNLFYAHSYCLLHTVYLCGHLVSSTGCDLTRPAPAPPVPGAARRSCPWHGRARGRQRARHGPAPADPSAHTASRGHGG